MPHDLHFPKHQSRLGHRILIFPVPLSSENDDGVLEIEGYGLELLQNVESDDAVRIQEVEVAYHRIQTKGEMLVWKAGISQCQPNWKTGSQDTSLRHVDGNQWAGVQRWNGFLRKYCKNSARVDQQRPATPVHDCMDVNQVIMRLE
jgi:hypothetical protein